MPSKYYLTLTTYGSDLIAQAHESAPLNLKNLVIGDANGVPYDPLTAIDRTHLVNQKASVLIQHLEVIDDVVRIQATVGANIGGFNIHEIGLTDETGQLVYIGNYHGGYKSLFEDGAGGELTISIDIKGVAANQINLNIDPNTNTATQAWVQQKLNEMMDVINRKEDIKIGDLFITTILFADSDAVHQHKSYGTWERYGDGQVFVAQASEDNNQAPNFMKSLGQSGGEYQHTMTESELFKHGHSNSVFNKFVSKVSDVLNTENVIGSTLGAARDDLNSNSEIAVGGITEAGFLAATEAEKGSSTPFNIVQPSITIAAWRRVA